MNCKTLGIFLCLQSAWTNVVTQPCQAAPDDKCHSSPSADIPDSGVAPLTEGSCEFEGTLCRYRQECTDSVNLLWQIIANQEYVQLTGQNGYMFRYSVLESPMLNINTVSCLDLSFSRASPSQLAVYLINSTSFVTLLPQTNTTHPSVDNVIHHFQKTVQRGQAKLRFRGFSGGGSAGNVRIYAVSVRPGGCEDPACRFEDDFCGWENVNWNISSGDAGEGMSASLNGYASNGNLQTPLVRSTECQHDCLDFLFKMSGTQNILSVSLIRSSGEKLLVWTVTSNGTTSTTWTQATIPVRIGEAYQVYFEATRTISRESEIGIDRVRYVRYTMGLGSCSFSPGYATMGSYTINSACDIVTDSSIAPQPHIKTTVTSLVGSTAIVTTSGANMSLHENQSGMLAPEDENNITAVAASVAGGVVFIAVIISCVLVWRRRRQQRNSRKANYCSDDGTAGITTRNEQRKGKHVSSEETQSNADLANGGDYSLVTEHTSPYEIAVVDGIDDRKSPPFLVDDEYNVVNVHSPGHNFPKPHGYSEDEYNHISTSPPVDIGVSALYSQVQKKGKRAATGQQPSGKQGPDPNVVRSQVPDPSAVYSQVQKKGKKPRIAAKPPLPKKPAVKDPYNKIDFSAPQSTEINGPADAVDMYNRLNQVHLRDSFS